MACCKCRKRKMVKPKTHQGKTWCESCWRGAFILRAIEMPISGPAESGKEWPELREALTLAWRHSTALANWAVHQLLTRDQPRLPSDEKAPPIPKVDLYNLGFTKKQYADHTFWKLATTSASCILRFVQGAYRKKRFHALWRQDERLPLYLFPFPYPVHNQTWSASFSDDASLRPIINLPINGKRWTLRLKGGVEFARQRARFEQIVSGEAKMGEASIYKKGDVELVKMVAWFPRQERTGLDGVMNAVTSGVSETGPAFLVIQSDAKAARIAKPFIINADHVRRWHAEHKRHLQRIAEDTKFEKRLPAWKRRQINSAREKRCDKHHNRLKTFLQQTAASVAKFAERQRVAVVAYVDDDKSFCPLFPWHQFKTALRSALDGVGVQMIEKEEKKAS